MHKICFTISLFHASTCFEHHVLIVRRSKLYCTASGIITPIGVMIPYSLWYHHTYRCDDTRGCNIQFCPPDDEHMSSKHVEAWNKLIIKFSASSWLILRNKYIEMHGQQNIKNWITYQIIQLKSVIALGKELNILSCHEQVLFQRVV